MARSIFCARNCRFAILAAAGAVWLSATPSLAQFGSIFGEPPRPPSEVPGSPPPRLQPPGPPRAVPAQPPQNYDRNYDRPATQYERPSPMPGPVQSQPLAPPPGVDVVPPSSANAPAPAQPPAAAPAGPGSPRNQPQPANAAPQPGDEVVTEMPAQKIVNPTAVFSGLDKITGRITSFDVAINETVQFGALQVTPRVCYTRPPTETPNTDAFIEVDEVTLKAEVKRIFTGWTFASSPGLRGVEHPIYDIWLTDCKGGTPPVAEAPVAQPQPTRASQRQLSQQPRTQPRQPQPQRQVLPPPQGFPPPAR
jgi:hypothetical protein